MCARRPLNICCWRRRVLPMLVTLTITTPPKNRRLDLRGTNPTLTTFDYTLMYLGLVCVTLPLSFGLVLFRYSVLGSSSTIMTGWWKVSSTPRHHYVCRLTKFPIQLQATNFRLHSLLSKLLWHSVETPTHHDKNPHGPSLGCYQTHSQSFQYSSQVVF